MATWDPFETLWLPHDAKLSGWQVLRAWIQRMNVMYRTVRDQERWPTEAARFNRAAWALRTRTHRRQIIADLSVQPGLLTGLGFDLERAELADALLTPLTGEVSLDEACDQRALAREAALIRLERRASCRRPWPPALRSAGPSPRGRSSSNS